MRLRNYIRKDEMPYTTPNGCVYDSGDYCRDACAREKTDRWDDGEEASRGAKGRAMRRHWDRSTL